MKSFRFLLIIITISYVILGFGAFAQDPAIILDHTLNYQTIMPAMDSFSSMSNAEMTLVNPPRSIYYGISTPVDDEGTEGSSPEGVLLIPQNAMDRYSITSPVAMPNPSLPFPVISPSSPTLISEIPLSPENHLISPINPNHQGIITLPDPADVSSGWLRTDLSSQNGVYDQTIGVWFKADISEAEGREIISALNPEFQSTVVNSRDLYMVVPRSDYERVIGLLRNESGVTVYDPNQPGTRIKEIEGQMIVLFSLHGDEELTKYHLQKAGFIIQKPLVMVVNIGQHDQDYYYTTMERLYQDEHVLRVTASSNACGTC